METDAMIRFGHVSKSYGENRVLDDLGLSIRKGELSGGQRQRAGIARALAAGPDILLMDEPFGAVDEITRNLLQTEIARIRRELGVTVVFITHDIDEALKLGDRVLVMNRGKIEQLDTPETIAGEPATPFVRELVGLVRRKSGHP